MTPLQKKEKIQIWITGALIIVLIFSIGSAMSKILKQRQVSKKAVANVTSALNSSEAEGRWLYHRLEDSVKNFDFKRDPFKKPHDYSTKFRLIGISWDEQGIVAIINDEVVQVGGVVAGYRVVEIRKQSVIVNDGSGNMEVWVGAGVIAK